MATNSYRGYRERDRWLRFLALCWAVAFLGGCGFHLRGPVRLPPQMNATYIMGGNRFGTLVTNLRQSLEASGASVVAKRGEAGAVLRILSQQVRRRVLSVAANGQPQEVQLYASVSFDLTDAKSGRQLLAPQTLQVRRDSLVSVTDVLGTASNEAFVRGEMDRDLVRLMLLRLQALAK